MGDFLGGHHIIIAALIVIKATFPFWSATVPAVVCA